MKWKLAFYTGLPMSLMCFVCDTVYYSPWGEGGPRLVSV